MAEHKRILVVDDDPSQAETVAELLGAKIPNSAIDQADSVAAAKTLLQGASFDLVVTDFEMPGANGVEFLQWMRAQEGSKNIPCIVLSGNDSRDIYSAAGGLAPFQQLQAEIVTKPPNATILEHKAKKLLGMPNIFSAVTDGDRAQQGLR